LVIHDRIATKPDTNIRKAAQKTLTTAPRSATLSQVGEVPVYGDSLGHEILAEREEYRSRLDNLEVEIWGRLDRLDEKLDEAVSNLQAQINELAGIIS
jgi:hypothetical protein